MSTFASPIRRPPPTRPTAIPEARRSARRGGSSPTPCRSRAPGQNTGSCLRRESRSATSSIPGRPATGPRVTSAPAVRQSSMRKASSAATTASRATSPRASASTTSFVRGRRCSNSRRRPRAQSRSSGESARAKAKTAGRPTWRRCTESQPARTTAPTSRGRSSSTPKTGRRCEGAIKAAQQSGDVDAEYRVVHPRRRDPVAAREGTDVLRSGREDRPGLSDSCST